MKGFSILDIIPVAANSVISTLKFSENGAQQFKELYKISEISGFMLSAYSSLFWADQVTVSLIGYSLGANVCRAAIEGFSNIYHF